MIFYIKNFPERVVYYSGEYFRDHRHWMDNLNLSAESDLVFTIKDGKIDQILKNRYFRKPHFTEEELVVLRLKAIPV